MRVYFQDETSSAVDKYSVEGAEILANNAQVWFVIIVLIFPYLSFFCNRILKFFYSSTSEVADYAVSAVVWATPLGVSNVCEFSWFLGFQ